MKISIVSPIKAYLISYSEEEFYLLKEQLSYKDLSAQHELKRLSKNHLFKSSNPVKYKVTYDLIKSKIYQCLIFEEGPLKFIRPGSIPYLKGLNLEIEDKIIYPNFKKIPWAKELPFQLYPYQKESVEKLILAKHGNIDICTGGGKTACILKIGRELGLQSTIVTPSSSIFNEILEKAEYHLGKGRVGAYGDGKKRLGKLITIATSKSLAMLKPGSKEYEFFQKTQCFLGDECHTLPSETLEAVCHGVLSDAPYRFFFSGSPTRNDGAERLLQSIIGDTVYTLTTREAVEKGFVSPHNFRIVQIESSDPDLSSTDPLEIKRIHFLRNKNICAFIAKLCNSFGGKNEQILVLCEEVNQIAMLLPKLTVPTLIAHSEKNSTRLQELGLYKVDPSESVEKFNRKEALVLLGTSCISVGVNLYPMTQTVNWQGGSSEIKTKQGAVGRSVRLPQANPYSSKCGPKESCTIWDFDVVGNHVLERHLEERINCYKDSGTDLIKYVRLKK
jgi:superfamily II DNA or RNA helicase